MKYLCLHLFADTADVSKIRKDQEPCLAPFLWIPAFLPQMYRYRVKCLRSQHIELYAIGMPFPWPTPPAICLPLVLMTPAVSPLDNLALHPFSSTQHLRHGIVLIATQGFPSWIICLVEVYSRYCKNCGCSCIPDEYSPFRDQDVPEITVSCWVYSSCRQFL